jgi:transcriptional regulator with XRE-family HTH domain
VEVVTVRVTMNAVDEDLRTLIAKRLDEALDEHGMSASELARKFGKSRSWLSNWRSGANGPPAEALALVCRELGISVDWVLGLTDERSPRKAAPASDFVYVPRLASAVAAGPPMIQDDKVIARLPFHRDFIKDVAPGAGGGEAMNRGRLVLVPVDRRWGDSMVPEIAPGELLLIDREPPEVARGQLKPGKVYLVSPDREELTAKFAAIEDGGHRLICWPRNPSAENRAFTIQVRAGTPLSAYVRGRVLWSAGRVG